MTTASVQDGLPTPARYYATAVVILGITMTVLDGTIVNLALPGIALNSMVVALASVAGPSVAAGILSVASWPWLFAVNLPLGVAIMWLGYRALPRSSASPPRVGPSSTRTGTSRPPRSVSTSQRPASRSGAPAASPRR